MIHTSDHCIPVDHPSLPGHFPGNPVVPGVVLLEEVMTAIGNSLPDFRILGLQSTKFLHPVDPGSHFRVELELHEPGKIRFSCHSGKTLLNTGIVTVEALRIPR